jgi:hypothetical protein
MSNIDKQALNQEKIEWLNKLADMEYCKSNPGHWLMSLKDTNMLAKLALRSVALLDELEAAEALNKHLELAIRKAEGCSEALRRKTEAAEKRIAEQQSAIIAPGIMRCAGCGFVLTKNSINMAAGTITAGDSKTEPCPNGCGPLWPVTWKEQALQMRDDSEQWFIELQQAKNRIAELEGGAFNPAILDVVAERQRQKTIEGWTPEHDDEHCNGELAMAAVCYINETGTVNRNGGKPWGWPWDASWWKPNARRRNLVKAGALILAEIERIDRTAMLQSDGTLTNEGTMQLSGNSEQIEPVSNRDELPLDYLQGHKDGLEWAAQLAEANHPQTGDWLYDDPIDLARAIRKGPDMPTVQGGNSPVIPDDVRRMDWLVSKTVDVREPMVYGSHSLFWSQTITDEEDDYHATKLREQIDAAMAAEQAASPQQEVNRG